jgi:hypothetical protein
MIEGICICACARCDAGYHCTDTASQCGVRRYTVRTPPATKASEHSYGHGRFCFYCGTDGETGDDGPCDESFHKKPTEAQMAGYRALQKLGDKICAIGAEVGFGAISLDEAVERIVALAKKD